MTVFVEYVIIDNFIFDYILLLLTFKSNGVEPPKKRLFLSALFGTVFAVIFPFLKFHQLVLLFLKIVLATSMVAIASNFNCFKQYLKKLIKFLVLTFAFGGIIYGGLSLVGVKYSFLYGTGNGALPLGIMLTLAISLYKLFEKLFLNLFKQKLVYPFTCKCVLKNKGQTVKVSAFLDSGNHLVFNGNGVCVAGQKLGANLYLSGFIGDNYLGEMKVYTIAGEGKIKIYEIEQMQIYFSGKANIINKVKIGVSNKPLRLSEEYELILSAGVIK